MDGAGLVLGLIRLSERKAVMTRTYTYQPRRISPRQHAELKALFAHLGWLRNQAVAKYRDDYKDGRTTASCYDLVCHEGAWRF